MKKVLAFDIEARGKSAIRNGILAVGVVLFDYGGVGEVMRKVWNVGPLPGQTYDETCLRDFWSKFPDTQHKLEQNPIDPQEFAHEFRTLLNTFDESNVFLLCDNPSFDAWFINYYLDFFGLDSMSHDSAGRFARVVHDADSFTRGFLRSPPTENNWVSNENVAEELRIDIVKSELHMPDEDAYAMLDFHLKLIWSNTQ